MKTTRTAEHIWLKGRSGGKTGCGYVLGNQIQQKGLGSLLRLNLRFKSWLSMRPSLQMLLVMAGTVASNCPVRGSALLDSLALIETGASTSHQCKADFKRGTAGEVSRYQIKPGVWRKYAAHQKYTDPATARRIAAAVLDDRMRAFWLQHLRAPSPFEVYVLWNAPAYLVGEWKGKTIGRPISDRAKRYSNIVSTMAGMAEETASLSYVLTDWRGLRSSVQSDARPPRKVTSAAIAE